MLVLVAVRLNPWLLRIDVAIDGTDASGRIILFRR
jgi:hypothetical protein